METTNHAAETTSDVGNRSEADGAATSARATSDDADEATNGERKSRGTLPRTAYGLFAAATALGAAHHVDHVIRGNHVGWPLALDVDTSTASETLRRGVDRILRRFFLDAE